jgi:hypothetical protein
MGYVEVIGYMLVTSPILMVLSGAAMMATGGLHGRLYVFAPLLGYGSMVAMRALALWGLWRIEAASAFSITDDGYQRADLLLIAIAVPFALYFALTGLEALMRMFVGFFTLASRTASK